MDLRKNVYKKLIAFIKSHIIHETDKFPLLNPKNKKSLITQSTSLTLNLLNGTEYDYHIKKILLFII